MQIIKNTWYFIQNQILGMKWLNSLIGNILSMFGLNINESIGASIQFFIYDTIKIFVLLSLLIFIISYIQSYFPPERSKRILGRFTGLPANTLAALLGTVTPFCSCSSIPLFMGFTSAGLPICVTFSFLISSPLVDLGSLILLMSTFGANVAIAYVVVGLILAVIGGTIIQKLNMEKYIEDFIKTAGNVNIESPDLSKNDRLLYAWEQVKETVKKVFWYVIAGVGIGAIIHNWIPAEIIQKILGENNPFSVVIATVIGIPIYADIFGTLPIAEALFAKGVGIGTVISFLMGVTVLSLPSIIMLRKVVKPKLLATFISIVAIGVIIIGYLFNAFQFLFA